MPLQFRHLQENLRRAVVQRIRDGELTQQRLAQKIGFQQAHVSNFLNRKRMLSLEAMDKVLAALSLSVMDLLDPAEVNKRASITPPSEDEFENVLLVEGAVAAAAAIIMQADVKGVLKFKKDFLKRMRADMDTPRGDWRRFVLVKMENQREAMSMFPRLLPQATVLIDRHYNSLTPYRKSDRNMYAVRAGGVFTVKYVERAGSNLVLRPENQAYPVTVLPMEEGRTSGDYIIGRVCYVGIET